MAFEENGQVAAQDQHSSEKGVELGHEKGLNNGVTAHGDEAGEPTVTAKTWIVCVVCERINQIQPSSQTQKLTMAYTDPLPGLWPVFLGRPRHVSHRCLDCG